MTFTILYIWIEQGFFIAGIFLYRHRHPLQTILRPYKLCADKAKRLSASKRANGRIHQRSPWIQGLPAKLCRKRALVMRSTCWCLMTWMIFLFSPVACKATHPAHSTCSNLSALLFCRQAPLHSSELRPKNWHATPVDNFTGHGLYRALCKSLCSQEKV